MIYFRVDYKSVYIMYILAHIFYFCFYSCFVLQTWNSTISSFQEKEQRRFWLLSVVWIVCISLTHSLTNLLLGGLTLIKSKDAMNFFSKLSMSSKSQRTSTVRYKTAIRFPMLWYRLYIINYKMPFDNIEALLKDRVNALKN